MTQHGRTYERELLRLVDRRHEMSIEEFEAAWTEIEAAYDAAVDAQIEAIREAGLRREER